MKVNLTTTNNKNGEAVYWHYHAIGVGVIVHYNLRAMQLSMTCQHTGQMVSCHDFYEQGGLSKEEFIELCQASYKDAIHIGSTLDLDYMDDPTVVGCVGVDFDLLKN
jgi:hypothetical protein